MWKKLNRTSKVTLIFILVLIVILAIVPLVAKKYINSNGEALMGRKMHLSSLGINYLSGAINLGELLIYEDNKSDTFFFVKEVYINPAVIASATGKYTVEELAIYGIETHIVLKDTIFNFISLINHFADTSSTKEEEPTEGLYYALEKISLSNAIFRTWTITATVL